MIISHLCLDIETVPAYESPEILPPAVQERANAKIAQAQDRNPNFDWRFFASVNWDFGKIACISLGYIGEDETISLRSFCGADERQILQEFNDQVGNFKGTFIHYNGLSFDVPFITRRMAHHFIKPANPALEDLRKFSKMPHYDVMLWYYNWEQQKALGLEALAFSYGLPSPKDVLGADRVYHAYLSEQFDRIAHYCEFDVATTLNLWRITTQYRRPIPLEKIRFSAGP